MATIRLSINPQDPLTSVVEAAGLATVTKLIELTYDQGATAITDASVASGSRQIKRSEILIAIEVLKEFIIQQTDLT